MLNYPEIMKIGEDEYPFVVQDTWDLFRDSTISDIRQTSLLVDFRWKADQKKLAELEAWEYREAILEQKLRQRILFLEARYTGLGALMYYIINNGPSRIPKYEDLPKEQKDGIERQHKYRSVHRNAQIAYLLGKTKPFKLRGELEKRIEDEELIKPVLAKLGIPWDDRPISGENTVNRVQKAVKEGGYSYNNKWDSKKPGSFIFALKQFLQDIGELPDIGHLSDTDAVP